ncbi:iron-containing alcohol dehydrogenase [Rhodospirillaceae bacterium SYSU D60014]|uniref:iron-containing alcohol dehydrogenase n=1 Tax=Virgifigura deserti TaxID=2268457 RepID=UPI000E66523B
MPLTKFSFGPTAPVAFGIDRVERLGADVAAVAGTGAPVLIVADPGVAAAGLVDRVEAVLRKDGLTVEAFTDVRSDPLGNQIDGAADRARSLGAACIVGLGGGSALDVAKLAAAIAPADQPAEHYALAQNPLPAQGLKKICLPTTAGTGSETTRTSVFTDGQDRKVWAWGEALRADLALLDPRLTAGLPPHLTAATGIDALVHAIEACTIRRANPLNDAICLQAIRLIARNLKRAVEAPDDLDARGAVQIAAAAGGIGIDNSGTGIAHAMGHALGVIGHVHHGRAVGLCLRAALAWNAEAEPARHAAVAEALGVPAEGRDIAALAAELAPAYDRFIRSVGLPVSLSRDGLSAADTQRLAEATMAPENKPMRDANIRAIAPADAERIAAEVLTAA